MKDGKLQKAGLLWSREYQALLVPRESTNAFRSSNLTMLFRCLVSTNYVAPLPCIKSTIYYCSMIHSDEGLKLETSVFESLYGG